MEKTDIDFSRYEYVRTRKVTVLRLVLRVYSQLGFLIAALAAGYLAVSMLPFSLSENQKIAAAIAGFGLAFAVMSKALIDVYDARERSELAKLREKEGTMKFLESWARFEEASKNALNQQGEKFDRHSVRSIISRLRADGKISDTDIAVLSEALEARNSIVHRGFSSSPSMLKRFNEVLEGIISKLLIV